MPYLITYCFDQNRTHTHTKKKHLKNSTFNLKHYYTTSPTNQLCSIPHPTSSSQKTLTATVNPVFNLNFNRLVAVFASQVIPIVFPLLFVLYPKICSYFFINLYLNEKLPFLEYSPKLGLRDC